jgi:16S rRNA (uracil1498-N3)-methyltransferase
MSRARSRGTKPAASRVYAPDAARDRSTVRLPTDEAHHLQHVLRMVVGDHVGVFDGAGHEWSGRIVSADRSGVAVELVAPIDPVPEPSVHVVLAIGLLKGDQMDSVVRDGTMLGVAEIVPMVTAHVAVPGHARESDKAIERWMRVAVASARQCGRAVVPRILAVTPFETVLGETIRDETIIAVEPAVADLETNPPYVRPADLETNPPYVRPADLAANPPYGRPKSALVLVGPEGGWSAAEVEMALKSGAQPRQLGPRTLRAESAPIVLLSSLWTEWGWF